MNTIETLRARVRDAALAVKASEGAQSDAAEALHAAKAQHEERAAECASADAAVREAEAKYLADQSDASGKAVLKAQDAARLATVRRRPADDRLEAATRAANAAAAAVARNHAEHADLLEALEYEEKLADLRLRAEPSKLSENCKPHWRGALRAMAMLESAGAGIAEAHREADRATAELRGMGEDAPDLDPVHALLPLLAHEVREGRRDFGNTDTINGLRYWFSHTGDGRRADLARVIFNVALHVNEYRIGQRDFSRTPEYAALRELAIRANTRTAHEADLLRHDLHRADATDRQADFERTYVPPILAFGDMASADANVTAQPAPAPNETDAPPAAAPATESPGLVTRIARAIAPLVT
jgi:hypothetical protein